MQYVTGNPKYKKGDIVKFYYDTGRKKVEHYGKIEIVDRYGTLEQSVEVSYDIMELDETCLYKHVVESNVYGVLELGTMKCQEKKIFMYSDLRKYDRRS